MLKETEVLKLYYEAIDYYNEARYNYYQVTDAMRLGKREYDAKLIETKCTIKDKCYWVAVAYKKVMNKSEESFQRDIDVRYNKFDVKQK